MLRSSKKITVIIAIALLIYGTVSLLRVKNDLNDALCMTEALENEINSICDENTYLQQKIDNIGTDEAVEDEAYERLGLVKSSDIIFIDK